MSFKKKLEQRWDLVKWALLAIILLCLTGRTTWVGWHIHGAAYMWASEGDEDVKDWVPEDVRKRNMYFFAGCCAIGIFIIGRHIVSEWRKRDDLEAYWLKMISDPESLKTIQANPKAYREDFKKWVELNYPHLKIWEPPDNSMN